MTTSTCETYDEQEQYYHDLCIAMDKLCKQKARTLYTLAYRSERNRVNTGHPSYWFDTGIARIDTYLGYAMDSRINLYRSERNRIEDDRQHWRYLAKSFAHIARKEIIEHYRAASRYSEVFNK